MFNSLFVSEYGEEAVTIVKFFIGLLVIISIPDILNIVS